MVENKNSLLDNRKNHKSYQKLSVDKQIMTSGGFSDDKKMKKKNRIAQKHRDRISIFKRKFSKIEMQINGKNSARVLVAISKICKVENVVNGDDYLRFCLDGKHLSKIIALLKNLCYDYKIINIGGMVPNVASVLARVGILAGVAVFMLCLSLYQAHVVAVDIDFIGTDNVALKAQVDRILQEYDVYKGAKFDNIDIDDVQFAISSLDNVAYAKVKKSGNRIVIQLKDALCDDYVFDIDGSTVKAKKRAVITKVIVEGGTSLKKHGDVVSQGDVIIDGYVEMGDAQISVEAKGYAFGIVYYDLSRFFPSEEVVIENGQTKRMIRLSMFGKVPSVPKSPYEKYTLKISNEDFGFLLPIKVYTYEFCETVQSIKPCTLTIDEMKATVYSSLLSKVESSAKIKDVHYILVQSENGTSVQVLMEVEERIT